MLCESLMFPHVQFQNLKQSSKYLFHDFVNSLCIFSLCFLLMISYKLSTKNSKARVAYEGAILVPIAVLV